ncbi:hypothetical protein B0I35DRAFT_443369 [Stachybotrys elegans]|uniref:Saccharopine dehydrogenase NADP binding domain-containing protein n=1 Tax=Stachybotrys elegans TaxID=80388 RepID=A0A8K0SJU9_9HYPO|nr:hypothetical protein B0I35DRAFT_443369 [Stachybotrys elegans]
MVQNILITGAGGYIGGNVLNDLSARKDGAFKDVKIIASVRQAAQVDQFTKLGFNAVQLDATDTRAVEDVVLKHEIDIVIHTAGGIEQTQVVNLIHALGARQKSLGEASKTYFIHAGVVTLFTPENGWPYGRATDADTDIFEKLKKLDDQHPIRITALKILEEGQKHNVQTLNIGIPLVYGTGTGPGRKISVNIPAMIRASKDARQVFKFETDARPPVAHIQDLSDLYVLLIEKILQGETPPQGEQGYYFAVAHQFSYWDLLSGLAKSLHQLGLVDDETVKTWPSWEAGADALGFPRAFIKGIAGSEGEMIAVKPFQLGWKPKWDEKRFLESIDEEIAAAEKFDTGKTSIFEVLVPSKA